MQIFMARSFYISIKPKPTHLLGVENGAEKNKSNRHGVVLADDSFRL
jgi:hypothetical protein